MRIAVLGDHVHPVGAPFAGGMEAMTWYLSEWLARQGHEVTLFGAPGSQVPGVETVELDLGLTISDDARRDISMPAAEFLLAHHAYLGLVAELNRHPGRFDLLHLHGLHHLPVALASALGHPSLLTLHSPPTPWLESALQIAGDAAPSLVTVSEANRRRWAHVGEAISVIPNGVDLQRWAFEPTAAPTAMWCGRINPEKAPHLAVRAARLAGLELALAGPMEDPVYFESVLAPLLGDGISYVGCVDHATLSRLVGRSAVLLQTPQWDEPFCLAAAEAIACGTPVAAFDRGGLGEVVGRHGGRLCEPGDVLALADAAREAAALPRHLVRRHAEAELSLDRCGARYEALFEQVVAGRHDLTSSTFRPRRVLGSGLS